MAYTFIQSVTNTGNSTLTFTSIPQTYKDLVIKISARQGNENAFTFNINGDSSSIYNNILFTCSGITAYGSNGGRTNAGYAVGIVNNGMSVASVFGNTELYITNYASTSLYKYVLFSGGNETNANEIYQSMGRTSYNSTSAITSFTITTIDGTFAANSIAYLYGIS